VAVTPAGFVSTPQAYGPVTFTIPAAQVPAVNFDLKLTDDSYPAATQTFNVRLPYVIGQTNFGAPANLGSISTEAEWVNDATARTLKMTAGKANVDSVVASEVIDLSAIGAVDFSAKFNITETSGGSNLEINDRFKAELLLDGGLVSEQRINLVDRWDTGRGLSSTAAPGTAGDKNGYINGYSGTAGTDLITSIAYTVAEDEYNANRVRDEFNIKLDNAMLNEIADLQLNNDFLLSYPIPAGASSAQLFIYGASFSGSETATVSEVLFAAAGGNRDTDGDGVLDADETIMGTSITDANDVLRISRNPANPMELNFPTKTGAFYRVYISDDAAAPTHLQKWMDANLGTFTGNGSTASFTIAPGTAPRRFYRLHVKRTDSDWPAIVPTP
jgi:hypothetical protein